jgi:hypothetical protein
MSRSSSRKRPGAITQERLRLGVVFGAALAAAAAPTAILACSAGSAAASHDAAVGDTSVVPPADERDEVTEADLADVRDAGGEHTINCVTTADVDSAYVPDGSDAEVCLITLPCGLPYGYATSGCEVIDMLQDATPIGCFFPDDAACGADVLQPGTALQLECFCDLIGVAGGGRRPAAWRLRASRVRGRTRLGLYLAQLAAVEAASIDAFRHLRDDLTKLGAPRELCDASGRAANDEVRHARMMGHLARRWGAETLADHRPRRTLSDLETVARENAVEGCLHETYGALLAHWQARNATDNRLRAAFLRIAQDETRHAALAWAIARWADGQLGARARARVGRARRGAERRLKMELRRPVDPAVADAAGLPSPAQARALLEAMVHAIGA